MLLAQRRGLYGESSTLHSRSTTGTTNGPVDRLRRTRLKNMDVARTDIERDLRTTLGDACFHSDPGGELFLVPGHRRPSLPRPPRTSTDHAVCEEIHRRLYILLRGADNLPGPDPAGVPVPDRTARPDHRDPASFCSVQSLHF